MMSSGAGADFVMMGGMLAGHDQSGEHHTLHSNRNQWQGRQALTHRLRSG